MIILHNSSKINILFISFITLFCLINLPAIDFQELSKSHKFPEEGPFDDYFKSLNSNTYTKIADKTRNSISVSGSISETEFWSADTVNVIGDILIENGISLTIDSGTFIDFHGFFAFDVQGQLLALGTLNDSICFTKSDTVGFSDFATPDGAWQGINFINTSADNDSSKISFCKIEFGKANQETTIESRGGAINITGFSKIKISNCTINNNFAVNSGGIVIQNCSPTITNCTIKYCRAEDSTGGLGCYFNADPIIDNCIIQNNSAFWGGGIECYSNSNPILSNLKIFHNSGTEHGGGLLCPKIVLH